MKPCGFCLLDFWKDRGTQWNTSRLLLMFSGYQNKCLSPWTSRWVQQKKYMDSKEYGGVPLKLPFAPF